MTYKTLTKICAAISGSSIVYMFLITYEGTYFGWTVFFVFLVLAILFHALDEKEEEIAILRSPKENKQIKEDKQGTDSRSGDPFYVSDKFNPHRKLVRKSKKESEITFIPTHQPSQDNQPPQNNDKN